MVAFNFLKLLIDLKDGWCFKTPKWIIFSLNVYFVIQLREPGKYESKERRRRRRRRIKTKRLKESEREAKKKVDLLW